MADDGTQGEQEPAHYGSDVKDSIVDKAVKYLMQYLPGTKKKKNNDDEEEVGTKTGKDTMSAIEQKKQTLNDILNDKTDSLAKKSNKLGGSKF